MNTITCDLAHKKFKAPGNLAELRTVPHEYVQAGVLRKRPHSHILNVLWAIVLYNFKELYENFLKIFQGHCR